MTAGFKATRLMKPIPAETVADAIIHTLCRPRFDVFVPRRFAAMHYVIKRLLPRAVGEPALRLMHADRAVLAALAHPNAPPTNSDSARRADPPDARSHAATAETPATARSSGGASPARAAGRAAPARGEMAELPEWREHRRPAAAPAVCRAVVPVRARIPASAA